jgi:Ca2+-transporting ATPase
MIIDPSCAIVFEAEAPEENVMDRPPRDSNKNILSFNNLLLPVLQGLGLLAVVVGLYIGLSSLGHEQRYAATVAFGVLMLGNLLLVVVSRSSGKTFTQIIRIPNNAQYWIGGIAITLFVVFVSSPFLRERFKFSELSMDSLYVVALSGMICLLWLELMKALARYRDRAA